MKLYFLSTWAKDLETVSYIEAFYTTDKTWNRNIEKAAMLPIEEAIEIADIFGGCKINWFEGIERKQCRSTDI